MVAQGKIDLQAVGSRGGEVVLVRVGGGDRAHVVDLLAGVVHPEFNVHSILLRGYWEPDVPPDAAERAVALVRDFRGVAMVRRPRPARFGSKDGDLRVEGGPRKTGD